MNGWISNTSSINENYPVKVLSCTAKTSSKILQTCLADVYSSLQEVMQLCCKYNADIFACSTSYIIFVVLARFDRTLNCVRHVSLHIVKSVYHLSVSIVISIL